VATRPIFVFFLRLQKNFFDGSRIATVF